MAYTNTTLATLRANLRERIFTQFWSDAELNAYISEALKVWNVLTGYNRQSTLKSIPGSTTIYSLAGNVANYFAFLRAERDDLHLTNITVRELDKMNRLWMCDEGDPQYIATIGLDHVIFYPISLTAFDVIIESIRTAPLPTTDSDYIQVGEEDLSSIINYAHFLCTLKEGGAELQVGIALLQDMMKQAATHNSKLNNISIFRKMLGYGGQNETRPEATETPYPRPPKLQ